MSQFACSTLPSPRAPGAAQVGHRARQDDWQITLQCTAVPGLVLQRGHQSSSQQYSASSSQASSACRWKRLRECVATPPATPSGPPEPSTYLALCGMWRIQLHGRWGSRGVLRYVRLPVGPVPVAGSFTGRDLQADTDSQSSIGSLGQNPVPWQSAGHP